MQEGQVLGFKRELIEFEPCSISEGRAVVKGSYMSCFALIVTAQVGLLSPTFALMRQAMAKNASSRTYCITDDWALAIDKAVAKLAHRDQQMGDIIWLYYGAKWAMVKVGKSYGISEGKARELARAGAAWIDCALCEIREAA